MNIISLDLYVILLILMPINAFFLRMSWRERDEELIKRQRLQDIFCMALVAGLTYTAYSGYFICWGIGACVAAGFSIHRGRLPFRAGEQSCRYILTPLGIAMTLAAFIPLLYLAKTGDRQASIQRNEEAAVKAGFKLFERIKEKPENPTQVSITGLLPEPAPYHFEVRATKTWDKKDSFYICVTPRRYGDKNAFRFALLPSFDTEYLVTGTHSFVIEASGVLLKKDSGGTVSKDREDMKSWRIVQVGADKKN